MPSNHISMITRREDTRIFIFLTHTEQLTEGIKFLLSEIWLITMQMKPRSLWIRHTVQLQAIITEAVTSVWLTSEQREWERTNWCGGRWHFSLKKREKHRRESNGKRKGRKTGQLSFGSTSGFTSEIQQSLIVMRRMRKGDWETRDWEGEKTSQGEIGKNQVVFTPICWCFLSFFFDFLFVSLLPSFF